MAGRTAQQVVVNEKVAESLNELRKSVPGLTWGLVLLLGVERGVKQYRAKMRRELLKDKRGQ